MADILSAISILLVFLIFLLTVVNEDINNWIAKSSHLIAVTEYKYQGSDMRKIIWFKSIPITLVFIVVSYTLSPKSLEILNSHSFSIWNFDVLMTLFIFIHLSLIVITIYCICQFGRLVHGYFNGININRNT